MNSMKRSDIVALMIGRGGSSLPDKNVRKVRGRPLLHYPANAARGSKHIGRFYVSSDCPKILCAAAEVGYAGIVRPAELSTPTSQSVDVVRHAISFIESEGPAKILVVQHANVGTVTTSMIDDCIDLLISRPDVSSVVPMHEKAEYHPYRSKKLLKDGTVESFFDFSSVKVSANRQDLPTALFFDHSFWVLSVDRGVKSASGQPPWQCMGPVILPYVTSGCFDVHSEEDLELTARWLEAHGLA
jgi:CMP-N-acetylneuraminic acid synthetase